MALLRLLHYTAQISSPSSGLFAAGEHSDYGMITLLATDHNSGLQIFDSKRSKQWIDVPPREGHFIVNLGDMLQRWSNDLFVSTLHRVVNSSGVERFSIPFFFEPNFDCMVSCLPTCCSAEYPPKYAPVTSGRYLMARYQETHKSFQNTTVQG